jgi:hypothetical protein
MLISQGFATKVPCTIWRRGLFLALAAGALAIGSARAQTASTKGSADAAPASPGFSIETEMLTYRALESNSAAVACDIAAYLNGATANFTNPPPGAVCDVKAGKSRSTVVLLPFDSGEFQDFQIWRADMATMARLHKKALVDCPSVSPDSGKGGSSPNSPKSSSVASALVAASPAGPPLAIAQSVLALMASAEATSPVGGTIHDQAFMDGVGRQLQELSVPVLMPTAYSPFSLVTLNESSSPFLSHLDRILMDRDECLDESASKGAAKSGDGAATKSDSKSNIPQRMVSEIEAYLGTLTGDSSLAPKDTSTAATPTTVTASSAKSPVGAQGGAVTAVPSSSHLSAVLLADGLAAKLGVDPDTGTLSPDAKASIHILLIQALESGGSVTQLSNVFGTKIRYSGGSIGTYALFTLDGDLECSGNVYEYGGSLGAKDFQEELRHYFPDPAKQMVFLRHNCRRLSQMP